MRTCLCSTKVHLLHVRALQVEPVAAAPTIVRVHIPMDRLAALKEPLLVGIAGP
jgi:hypothetical protein